MDISIMKIGLWADRLIFIMGILILVGRHLYIKTAPKGPKSHDIDKKSFEIFWIEK